MTGFLDGLAEARIREWQRRVAAGEIPAERAHGPFRADSLEAQLFSEILALREAARALPDGPERKALRARASDLRLQLLIGLERDRPLLARTLDERLAAADRDG